VSDRGVELLIVAVLSPSRPFPWLLVGVGLLAAGAAVTAVVAAAMMMSSVRPLSAHHFLAGGAARGPSSTGRPSSRASARAAGTTGASPTTGKTGRAGTAAVSAGPGSTANATPGATTGPVGDVAAAQACGGVCIDVDPNHALGPARLVAQGFIHGVDSSTNPQLLSVLHPQSWLFEENEAAYSAARAQNATVTDILSDDWYRATYTPGHGSGVPPWTDWHAYAQWVQAYVRATLADHHVDYWDIQNEPDGPIDGVRPTVSEVLQEFSVAANAIRSVDPSAKVMGPSLSAFNDQPGNTLDLATFLDTPVT